MSLLIKRKYLKHITIVKFISNLLFRFLKCSILKQNFGRFLESLKYDFPFELYVKYWKMRVQAIESFFSPKNFSYKGFRRNRISKSSHAFSFGEEKLNCEFKLIFETRYRRSLKLSKAQLQIFRI